MQFSNFKNDLLGYVTMGKIPAFIHIPKTGGTYLNQFESDRQPVLTPLRDLGHCCVTKRIFNRPLTYPPTGGYKTGALRNYYHLKLFNVFTNVRNIFDWLVSYWGHAAGTNDRYRNEDHYDFAAANRGFEYLVKQIMDRESIWPSRKFIFTALFAYEGDLIVDWINRLEQIDEDLISFAASHPQVSYIPKPRQRIGVRQVDYRSYYSDTLADLVYQTWQRELELYGYSFDGLDDTMAILRRSVTYDQRAGIKYYWDRDLLEIDSNLRDG